MEEHEQQLIDLQQLERGAIESLLAAKKRPLSDEEIMAVAYSAGVANAVYKELRK